MKTEPAGIGDLITYAANVEDNSRFIYRQFRSIWHLPRVFPNIKKSRKQLPHYHISNRVRYNVVHQITLDARKLNAAVRFCLSDMSARQ